jgi:hypothetical protein
MVLRTATKDENDPGPRTSIMVAAHANVAPRQACDHVGQPERMRLASVLKRQFRRTVPAAGPRRCERDGGCGLRICRQYLQAAANLFGSMAQERKPAGRYRNRRAFYPALPVWERAPFCEAVTPCSSSDLSGTLRAGGQTCGPAVHGCIGRELTRDLRCEFHARQRMNSYRFR